MLLVVEPPNEIPCENWVKLVTPVKVLLFGKVMVPASVRLPALVSLLLAEKNWISPDVPLFKVNVPLPLALTCSVELLAVAAMTGLVPVRLIAVAAFASVSALIVTTLPVAPPCGESVIFPVVAPPIVNGRVLVVPKLPAPDKNVELLPELAETFRTGVPALTLSNPNFALDVALDPSNKS